jgi:hypothetical protein
MSCPSLLTSATIIGRLKINNLRALENMLELQSFITNPSHLSFILLRCKQIRAVSNPDRTERNYTAEQNITY